MSEDEQGASIRRPNLPRSIRPPGELEALTVVWIGARGQCFRSMAKGCRRSKLHQTVIPWSG